MNLKELISQSIAVYDGMVAHYPQLDEDSPISVVEIVSKFNGRYAMNNSTIAFIYNEQLYSTPYRSEVTETLRAESFREDSFYVPFSNWDYPKEAKERWEYLRKMAQRDYDKQHEQECSSWCDEHNIGVIANIKERCFRMPNDSGLHVKYPQGYEGFHYAMCSRGMDPCSRQYLGKFCRNNGVVAFNYRDGSMYLTKGYKIIKELTEAGYVETSFTVPLSNGEVIMDNNIRVRWDSIEKNQI